MNENDQNFRILVVKESLPDQKWSFLLKALLTEYLCLRNVSFAHHDIPFERLLHEYNRYRPHFLIVHIDRVRKGNRGVQLLRRVVEAGRHETYTWPVGLITSLSEVQGRQEHGQPEDNRKKDKYKELYLDCDKCEIYSREDPSQPVEGKLVRLIEKNPWDVERFLMFIEKSRREFKFNPQLEVTYSGTIHKELIAWIRSQFRLGEKEAREELEEFFKRLLYNGEYPIRLHIHSFPRKEGESKTRTVLAQVSYDRKDIYLRPELQLCIKIGQHDVIRQENENYDEYRKLMGDLLPTKERFHYGFYLAGIIYDALDDLDEFSTHFATSDADSIIAGMRDFFKVDCSLCYKNRDSASLLSFYRQQLDLALFYLDDMLYSMEDSVIQQGQNLVFSDLTKADLPNPIHYFDQISFDPQVELCPTHGNLDVRHILVDNRLARPKWWIVNFSRAGLGHILQDFARLEASLKLEMLNPPSMSAWFEFECALLAGFSHSLQFPNASGDASLAKAFRIIQGLRRLARDVSNVPESCFSEYCVALLFETLDILRFVPEDRRVYAFLSAAMICQELDTRISSMGKPSTGTGVESQELYRILNNRLNKEELKTLCFRLHIDYDSLSAEGKAAKIRELIKYFERRDKLDKLQAEVKKLTA